MGDSDVKRVERAISEARELGWILHVKEEPPGRWQAWGAPAIRTQPPTGVVGQDFASGASEVEAAEAGLAAIRTIREEA
jgi:hypothetical protein